jgi:hypothetical protein
MGFVGRLEDLSLTDIIQIMSLGKRTGKLTLTRRKQQALIVFLNGGIVYCRSSSVHETLGSILVNRNLISESTLLAALDRQQAEEGTPLGAILVSMEAIKQEVLDDLIREQIKNVLSELITWESGVFQFETVELADGISAALDANEFLVEEGLHAEEMVLELLTQLDEARFEEGVLEDDVDGAGPEQSETTPEADKGPSVPKARTKGFASLKSIMSQLRSRPITFTGEITLMLLRYTAELVNRCVLFAVTEKSFMGIGQFGIEISGESADSRVRAIKIPRGEPSVLEDVATKREPYKGRLVKSPWNNQLLQQLGGRVPREVVAAPIIVNDEPVAVIYGDNLPDETAIGPTEGLELLMIEAGLLLEKHSLELQLKDMQDEGEE